TSYLISLILRSLTWRFGKQLLALLGYPIGVIRYQTGTLLIGIINSGLIQQQKRLAQTWVTVAFGRRRRDCSWLSKLLSPQVIHGKLSLHGTKRQMREYPEKDLFRQMANLYLTSYCLVFPKNMMRWKALRQATK